MSGIEDGYAMWDETHPEPRTAGDVLSLDPRPAEGTSYGQALDAERKVSGVEAGRVWFTQRGRPAPRRAADPTPGEQASGTPEPSGGDGGQ